MGDARAAGAKSTKCESPEEQLFNSPQGFLQSTKINPVVLINQSPFFLILPQAAGWQSGHYEIIYQP